MRYIVIGDIHGCAQELLDLLELVDLHPNDKVISIGDIIHKGPDEVECIRIMDKYSCEYILGNHEEKQLRWEKHNQIFLNTGKKNPMKNVEDYNPLPDFAKNWLKKNARIFMTIHAGEQEYMLVHGGIEPRMRIIPSSNNPWALSNKEKSYFWKVLRTRYVNPDGKMVSLGKETEEDVYWADVYDGRFGHVIFGHQPFPNRNAPRVYEHATGIDLGCVYGNVLCAAIIDGDTGEMTYRQVSAHEKYQTNRFTRDLKGKDLTIPAPE